MKPHVIEKDWITHAGFRAVVLAHRHRCGYVGLPKGHPFYGIDYNQDLPALAQVADSAQCGKKSPILIFLAACSKEVPSQLQYALDVHGGLTYSSGGDKYPVESDLWWLGFDCGHYDDAPIPENMSAREKEIDEIYPIPDCIVRSLDYVVDECERLADQIMLLCPVSASETDPDRKE